MNATIYDVMIVGIIASCVAIMHGFSCWRDKPSPQEPKKDSPI